MVKWKQGIIGLPWDGTRILAVVQYNAIPTHEEMIVIHYEKDENAWYDDEPHCVFKFSDWDKWSVLRWIEVDELEKLLSEGSNGST